MARLQGLDRGLDALEFVSTQPGGVGIAALAAELRVDRAVAYRVVETLEAHGLLTRADGRRIRLGAGIIAIADRFQPQLVHAARPVLQELADATGAAAFLTLEQSGAEGMPVVGAEPRHPVTPLQISYRIGARHPLTRGANGIAILALRAPATEETTEVTEARERGFSITSGHLQPGTVGLAAGFWAPGGIGASVGIVAVTGVEVERQATRVIAAATQLHAQSLQ